MAKIILLALAVWLLVVIARQYLRNINRSQQNDSQDNAPAGSNNHGQSMVKCLYCGTHVPVAEAIVAGNAHYCSQAHCDADG